MVGPPLLPIYISHPRQTLTPECTPHLSVKAYHTQQQRSVQHLRMHHRLLECRFRRLIGFLGTLRGLHREAMWVVWVLWALVLAGKGIVSWRRSMSAIFRAVGDNSMACMSC